MGEGTEPEDPVPSGNGEQNEAAETPENPEKDGEGESGDGAASAETNEGDGGGDADKGEGGQGAEATENQHEAATKIQARARGVAVRKKLEEGKASTKEESKGDEVEATGAAATEATPEQHAAATKIQARVRGNAVRGQKENNQNAVGKEFDITPETATPEQVEAATKIQARARGMAVRKDGGVEESKPSFEGTPEEHEAATKIQARARGMKVRNDKDKVSPETATHEQVEAATKIQAHARGMAVRNGKEGDSKPSFEGTPEEHEAATKIQARARGMKVRNDKDKVSPETATPEQVEAAIKIQAHARGMQARDPKSKTNPVLAERHAAATKIQSHARGMATRANPFGRDMDSDSASEILGQEDRTPQDLHDQERSDTAMESQTQSQSSDMPPHNSAAKFTKKDTKRKGQFHWFDPGKLDSQVKLTFALVREFGIPETPEIVDHPLKRRVTETILDWEEFEEMGYDDLESVESVSITTPPRKDERSKRIPKAGLKKNVSPPVGQKGKGPGRPRVGGVGKGTPNSVPAPKRQLGVPQSKAAPNSAKLPRSGYSNNIDAKPRINSHQNGGPAHSPYRERPPPEVKGSYAAMAAYRKKDGDVRSSYPPAQGQGFPGQYQQRPPQGYGYANGGPPMQNGNGYGMSQNSFPQQPNGYQQQQPNGHQQQPGGFQQPPNGYGQGYGMPMQQQPMPPGTYQYDQNVMNGHYTAQQTYQRGQEVQSQQRASSHEKEGQHMNKILQQQNQVINRVGVAAGGYGYK